MDIGGVLLEAVQNILDMTGIQLHETALHHVSGPVVTGNADIFPFRADGIDQQIQDFLQGLPIVGILLKQVIKLQSISEIALIGPAFRHPIRIPSYPVDAETSESLNVGIATAIVLAEFRR